MLPAFHIKKTIDFNRNFRSLLEVLKFVAVSEYHNLERRLRTFERLADEVSSVLAEIDFTGLRHPFLGAEGKPPLVLAVTTDQGLLGGLNNQVVSKAVEILSARQGHLVIVGERGIAYAQEMGIPTVSFPGIQDERRFQQAMEVRDYLISRILSGEAGGLIVVYPRALTFVLHRVETVQLIPFEREQAEGAPPPGSPAGREVIFESPRAGLVEYLIYLTVGQRLFEIFGMSRVTEQAARFTHLEESCQKIQEMNKKLTLQYFRRRHEVIDANMRELFSARSLYAGK